MATGDQKVAKALAEPRRFKILEAIAMHKELFSCLRYKGLKKSEYLIARLRSGYIS